MEIGIVRQVDIDQQMQEAYLDYAMSVIVARALPDVRDGLKPVHRRILYAMHDMGVRPHLPYRKSARIVGEVLGKYHPHGDAAVYDAMARMAQDFSMRIPLVDGQGNFGSVDGDPPAAMRYTEARLAPIAGEIMADIDKNTVDFGDNFDGSLTEPNVLPTKVPNLLVNGASGIAVGMATSIPPHNLGEICDALIFMTEQMSKNKEITLDDLLTYIKGPDFPTGGIIYRCGSSGKSPNTEENDLIKAAYAVGRGRLIVQAKVHIEEMSRNRNRLVITELPYQTNKSSLVEKIAELARDGKIEGIADLRDESDRQGMRLAIELTRTVEPKAVLKQLFKLTPLQSTFSINMLALVEGEPRLVSLRRALQFFIEHRLEIITRRSQYELDRAQQRAHILEGLRVALSNLDEVIRLIRSSRSTDTARTNLCKTFKLTETQANAILDMPLRRLAALERKKIETEYKEILKDIAGLQGLLKSQKKILGVIKDELLEMKETFASPRRTLIINQTPDKDQPFTARDLVPDENSVVALTETGQICRWNKEQGLDPVRGTGAQSLSMVISTHTREKLYLFTATGQAILLPAHQIPEGAEPGEGIALAELRPEVVSPVVAGIALSNEAEVSGYLFLVSKQGRVKRVALAELQSIRGHEAAVIGLEEGDCLVTAFITPGEGEVMLVTAMGQGIRFAEEEVRPMGLPAVGVWGIKLAKNDEVIGGGAMTKKGGLLVVTGQGSGKRIAFDQVPKQGRYGQGVIVQPNGTKAEPLVAAAVVQPNDRVMFISRKNTKIIYARSLPQAARTHKGSSLIAIRGRDRLERLVILEK